MSKTLIIWDTFEGIQLFIVPDEAITAEYRTLLHDAHGKYINGDYEESSGLSFINAAVSSKPEYCMAEPAEWRCIFFKYKTELPTSPLSGTDITEIVVTGFIP